MAWGLGFALKSLHQLALLTLNPRTCSLLASSNGLLPRRLGRTQLFQTQDQRFLGNEFAPPSDYRPILRHDLVERGSIWCPCQPIA